MLGLEGQCTSGEHVLDHQLREVDADDGGNANDRDLRDEQASEPRTQSGRCHTGSPSPDGSARGVNR